MSVPSCSSSGNGSKEAELARLSDLFQSLASRRPRPHSLSTVAASSTASKDNPHSTPNIDAADRVQDPRYLSKSAVISHERDAFAAGTVTDTRPRRNTVASFPTLTQTYSTFVTGSISSNLPQLQPTLQADEDIDAAKDNGGDLEPDAEAALAKFPLTAAKKYQFTFKLMIYKLYKKEDWVKTIKEMLEKSKNEFKPLAEKEKGAVYAGSKPEEASMPPPNKDAGAVRFKLVSPSPGQNGRQRRTSGVGIGLTYATHIRQRSMSTLGTSGPTQNLHVSSRPTAPYPRSPFPKSPPPASPSSPNFGLCPSKSSVHFAEPAVRVLKKRCVGRRRSMSLSVPSPLGTANNENQEHQPHIRGTWVYNAAISRSALERPVAANPNSLMRYLPNDPPPSPTGDRFPRNAPLNPKNQNIPNASENMLQTKALGVSSSKSMMMTPLPLATNRERLVARRRAMTIGSVANDNPITEQRKAAKRPFTG